MRTSGGGHSFTTASSMFIWAPHSCPLQNADYDVSSSLTLLVKLNQAMLTLFLCLLLPLLLHSLCLWASNGSMRALSSPCSVRPTTATAAATRLRLLTLTRSRTTRCDRIGGGGAFGLRKHKLGGCAGNWGQAKAGWDLICIAGTAG